MRKCRPVPPVRTQIFDCVALSFLGPLPGPVPLGPSSLNPVRYYYDTRACCTANGWRSSPSELALTCASPKCNLACLPMRRSYSICHGITHISTHKAGQYDAALVAAGRLEGTRGQDQAGLSLGPLPPPRKLNPACMAFRKLTNRLRIVIPCRLPGSNAKPTVVANTNVPKSRT